MKITLKEVKEITREENMFFKKMEGDLILFSYHYLNPKVYLSNPIATELRGIIFDTEGELVARPYPRFPNFGSNLCDIDEDAVATTAKKIDGSLLIGFTYDGEIRFASKGSLSSWVVKRAQRVITDRHRELIRDMDGRTVLFELKDPNHPIVIGANDLRVILTGIREIQSGEVIDPRTIQRIGDEYGVETPPIMHNGAEISDIKEDVKGWEEKEGVVGHTDEGLFKVKSDWYLELHDTMKMTEKKVKEFFINNELDDVYPDLPEKRKGTVDEIVEGCEENINQTEETVRKVFNENDFETRKELALYVIEHHNDIKSIFFKVWEGEDVGKATYEYFKRKWG